MSLAILGEEKKDMSSPFTGAWALGPLSGMAKNGKYGGGRQSVKWLK
jgi:hypothetical protein